ncbi:MAG: alpha/beta hydrolase [Sterolibacterium sp.]
MSSQRHHLLNINGVRIHAVEEGHGPLVLLLHGFPELWYSWRHQLPALAAAGYRAVAIDQRGYGRSSKFMQPDAYRITRLVDDAVGVVKALGESTAVVVGHDWGAPVAWTSAWLHPEVFRGVVGLSIPFSGRGLIALPGSPFGEIRPDALHRELAGPGNDFYQNYFGKLGAVIEEMEEDVHGWLRAGMYSLSGEALGPAGIDFAAMDPVALIRGGPLCIPHGTRMKDRFVTPAALPAWLSETDLDFFVAEYERTGFGGGLMYYRNLDQDWEDLAAQATLPLIQPALYVSGDLDICFSWGQEAIRRAQERLPNYRGSHILKGCGHWTQQERPEETNRLLIEFLKSLG